MIDDYNQQIQAEQIDLQTKADHGVQFAVDVGPDYRPQHRLQLNELYMAESPYLLKIATYNDYLVLILVLMMLFAQASALPAAFSNLYQSKKLM